jgi:hypothetical protein
MAESATKHPKKPAQRATLPEPPPWITLLDDGDVGWEMPFVGIDPAKIVGHTFCRARVLQALDRADRPAARKFMREGHHPVLVVDLESGAATLELRHFTPNRSFSPLTPLRSNPTPKGKRP